MKNITSLIFTAVLVLTFVVLGNAQVKKSEKTWLAGEKKDDIETFYQMEKIGSDSYEVLIKVVNNRDKSVVVESKLQTGKLKKATRAIFGDEKRTKMLYNCFLVVAPGESAQCRIQTLSDQIGGVSISSWKIGNRIPVAPSDL